RSAAKHSAGLRGPAHLAREAALSHIPLAGERCHVRLQFLLDLLKSHRNQRLDQRDAGVPIRSHRRRHRHDADVLSFPVNLSYLARHGWCPPLELSCSVQEHSLLYGVATRISTNRSTHSLTTRWQPSDARL